MLKRCRNSRPSARIREPPNKFGTNEVPIPRGWFMSDNRETKDNIRNVDDRTGRGVGDGPGRNVDDRTGRGLDEKGLGRNVDDRTGRGVGEGPGRNVDDRTGRGLDEKGPGRNVD